MTRKITGFTIVELLIVIVVIGILTSITLATYANFSAKARDSARMSDLRNVQKLNEIYYIKNGEYPKTATNIGTEALTTVRTDANYYIDTAQADWVPNIDQKLPQSISNKGNGLGGNKEGCYMYASDGQRNVLSARNNIETGPQTAIMYRRLGFRENCNETPPAGA